MLQDYISIGRITKPHGLKGGLKFFVYNESSIALLNRKKLIVSNKLKKIELRIEELNLKSSSYLIKFFNINDRNDAENYRDFEIYIPRSDLADDGDIFLVDFIECELFFEDKKIGTIVDVVSYSSNNLLKVVSLKNKNHLIPIKKELIKFFDKKNRKLVMQTIEGVLDIC
ncbi:MAG: 16S rRNA processing protein RimM [Candidatus Marinimicrobia bacterium]|nr:16S rRNA processing protein RimM [Candidatus Neomarinimicrobiota bacterium]|tara:strand:- start:9661 stop:10170 length:510 start_codon:yes stop_codon:yes gene_type:complete